MTDSEKEILKAVQSNGTHIAKIFTRLGIMETTQSIQHKMNVDDISELKVDIKKYTTHGGHIKAQWVLLIIVIGWLVSLSKL